MYIKFHVPIILNQIIYPTNSILGTNNSVENLHDSDNYMELEKTTLPKCGITNKGVEEPICIQDADHAGRQKPQCVSEHPSLVQYFYY